MGDSPETIIQNTFIAAATAGVFYGAGEFIQSAGGIFTQVTEAGSLTLSAELAQTGVHFAAGAASGAIGSAVTGGDVGLGALTGGMSGGMGHFFGGSIPPDAGFGIELAGYSLIGGITGGISSELYGGDFTKGFGQGAFTAAFGLLFNKKAHRNRNDFDKPSTTPTPDNDVIEFPFPGYSKSNSYASNYALCVYYNVTKVHIDAYLFSFGLLVAPSGVSQFLGIATSFVMSNKIGYDCGKVAAGE